MRKYIVSLFCVLATSVVLAESPISVEVFGPLTGSNNTVCILPPRMVQPVPLWVTNQTVVSGSVWKNSNGGSFLVVRGGLVTPSDMLSLNALAVTGGVTVLPAQAVSGLRQGFQVSNISTCKVYLSIGGPAVSRKGIYLAPSTGTFMIPSQAPQGPVFAQSDTTNATILAQEW